MYVALRALLCGVLLVLSGLALDAQAPFRLQDLWQGASNNAPSHSVPNQTGSIGFFGVDLPAFGSELWKTDGTTNGTVMVRDVNVGAGNGATDVYQSGSTAYFAGYAPATGWELWKSDGTSGGTTLVEDICPGTCSSRPGNFATLGSTIYFFADDDVHGEELWRTDGTPAGTYLVLDILPGVNGSPGFEQMVQSNGLLYFVAYASGAGDELWKSDGTAGGTQLVKDICPGSGNSGIQKFVRSGVYTYFLANDCSTGQELWRTDGTAAGTLRLADANPGSSGASISGIFPATSGNIVFFTATSPAAGEELWRSDGTTANTAMVADLCSGTCTGAFDMVAVLGSVALFSGRQAANQSVRLWRSDGTAGGTSFVKDVTAATNAIESGGNVLFAGLQTGGSGLELWKTDGTEAGTTLVFDINTGGGNSNPRAFGMVNSRVLFLADSASNKAELWSTDGTTAGTAAVRDIIPDAGGSTPIHATAFGDRFLFAATTAATGSELWTSDGTSAGTALLADVRPGAAGSIFTTDEFVPAGGTCYFTATTSAIGSELYKTDGTTAGTALVKDIEAGSGSSNPRSLVDVSGTLFFSASQTGLGTELWKSDGTAAGTVLVKDLAPGSSGTFFEAVAMNGTLFFTPYLSNEGQELWKSDGTDLGTVLVRDLDPGLSSGYDGSLTNANGLLYFAGNDDVAGSELFRSDGSAAGTALVADVTPGASSSGIQSIVPWSGGIAFLRSGAFGADTEWWKSDGTAAGTVQLADVNPGAGSVTETVSDRRAVVMGSHLYFAGRAADADPELWRIHLANGGAELVRDLCVGCASSPSNLTKIGSRIYFTATDNAGGTELWRSDGTLAGTVRVADIEPGPGSSNPQELAANGNLLFFTAYTSSAGREPYVACDAPATQFAHTMPALVVSAGNVSFTVSPRDSALGPVPCYTGTVQITSSDPAATLPANHSFVAGQAPQSFDITLRTLGPQTITVRDTVTLSIVTTINVNVGASPVHSTITPFPGALIANGTSVSSVTVRYKDANNANLGTGGGTLALSTTRGTISTPINNNDGTYTATLTASTVAGTATITGVLDGIAMTQSATVEFVPGSPTQFAVTAPSTALADVPFSVTVTAMDAHGNTTPSYTGTVHFAVNDSGHTVPPDTQFQPFDGGVRTFTDGVSLNTVGNRVLTVTDTANGSISGVAVIAVDASSTTTVTSSLAAADPNVNVTLTATVTSGALGGPPTGNVTFKDGTTTLATVALTNGSATFSSSTFAWGPHPITAEYAGDSNFLASTSPVFQQVIVIPGFASTATRQANGSVRIAWSAAQPGPVQMEVWRASTLAGGFAIVGTAAYGAGQYDDATAAPDTVYLYRVRALDAGANPGRDGGPDLANTRVYTDPVIASGSIAAKVIHVSEVRAAIDGLRALAGLAPATYSRTVTAGSAILATDFLEMRDRLDAARSSIPGLAAAPAYFEPALTAGTTIIDRRHLLDLRERMD